MVDLVEMVHSKLLINLTDCTSTNTQDSIDKGEWYYSNIMASNEGSTIYVTVTMGGEDITNNVCSFNDINWLEINIPSVSGDIVMTVTGSASNSRYTISNKLTNCTSNNTSDFVSAGYGYNATLKLNSGYTTWDSIIITKGGQDISSSAYTINDLNWCIIKINGVDGNIVIKATGGNS